MVTAPDSGKKPYLDGASLLRAECLPTEMFDWPAPIRADLVLTRPRAECYDMFAECRLTWFYALDIKRIFRVGGRGADTYTVAMI